MKLIDDVTQDGLTAVGRGLRRCYVYSIVYLLLGLGLTCGNGNELVDLYFARKARRAARRALRRALREEQSLARPPASSFPGSEHGFRVSNWRMKNRAIERGSVFAAGAVCALALVAAAWGGWIWRKPEPQRSAEDSAIYDTCLAGQRGNTVACDAWLRIIERERIHTVAVLDGAAKMLAAGYSKSEVYKWSVDNGLVGSDLAKAVGLSQEDLIACTVDDAEHRGEPDTRSTKRAICP